jgi:GDP-D-mannose dehydratase
VHYQYNPIKRLRLRLWGAINTLGLAKRVKAKILQASTSEVYGDPRFIRNRRPIGNVNLSEFVLAMTKGNVVQRLYGLPQSKSGQY